MKRHVVRSLGLLLLAAGSLQAKVIFKSDMRNYANPNKSDFAFTPPGVMFSIDDVKFKQLKKGGVAITSRFLENSAPFDSLDTVLKNGVHHLSGPIIDRSVYDPNNPETFLPAGLIVVGPDEKVQVKTVMSVQAEGLENNPYNLKDETLPLAFAGPILISLNAPNQITVCFFLSKDAIYAFNDAIGLTSNNFNVERWISFKKVKDRKPCDVHCLINEYDRKNNVLRWFVDGQKVAEWDLPGFPAFADYNGMAPSPINPGVPNAKFNAISELPRFLSPDELGFWTLGLAGPSQQYTISLEPGGVGQWPMGGAPNIEVPTQFKFDDINEIAGNQWKFLRNVVKKSPCPKKVTAKVFKVEISVDKVENGTPN